jgi:hypothetical protein
MVGPSFSLFSSAELTATLQSSETLAKAHRDVLIRSQVTMMRAECQALQSPRNPTNLELKEMAQTLIRRYPALKDDVKINPNRPWVS